MLAKFSRRTLIRTSGTSAIGLMASSLPFVRPVAAAGADLTIYGTWEMTAPGIADAAALSDRGSRLAVETLAKPLHITCKYETIDSEGDPGKGVRKVDEQSSQTNARFFVGGASSAVALAVSKEVNKLGGVYTTTGGADELTGTDCAKSTFRWPVATYGAVESTVRPLRQKLPEAKRWFTITPKYVFGDALLRNTQRVLAETGAEHVGNSYHTLKEREFSGYLTEALAARPDVLCIHNFAGQTIDVLRQAAEFGLKGKMTILIVWASGLDQFRAMGADLLDGVYLCDQYWHTVENPTNKELVAQFQSKYKSPPTSSEVKGYMLARLIMEGAAKAGSSDPAKVVAALEGMKYAGPTGMEEVRASDHQCLKDYYLMRGKPAAKMSDANDFVEILASTHPILDPTKTGCTAI